MHKNATHSLYKGKQLKLVSKCLKQTKTTAEVLKEKKPKTLKVRHMPTLFTVGCCI